MKCTGLSASRDKTYGMCEFKYYLGYHLGIQEEKKFPTEQGTFCHEIYEILALQVLEGQKNPKILKEWFGLLLNAYRNTRKVKNRFGYEEEIPPLWTLSKKALERDKTCESCKYFADGNCWVAGKKIDQFEGCPRDEFDDSVKLIEQVIYNPGPLNPLNKTLIAAEDVFQLQLEDGAGEIVKVNGIIDLVTELDSESIEIEDYKTGKWTQTWLECQEDIQFLIYFVAARAKYPQYKNVFVTAHYLKRRSGRSPTMAFSDKDEAETRQRIVRRYHEIRNNKFPVRRCDRANGFVKFDWVCEYLCDPEACQREYEKVIKVGHIENEDA